MESQSFSDVFRGAQDGDEVARERLYQLALRLALRAARKRLSARDRELLETQDVRQSVLLRLHVRLPDLHFDAERDLAAWLAEVTRRVLREKHRNAHRDKRDVRRNVPFPTAGLPDADAKSIRRAVARIALEDKIDELPPETAEVVRLHALEGHTFGSVAERLGLAGPEAARKRYARALVKLGGLLGEADGP